MAGLHPLGIRESSGRTLATALLVAVLLHLPFTPLPFMLRWLSVYLNRGDTSWDYKDDSVIIPISLVDDEPAARPAAPVVAAPPATTNDPKPAATQRGDEHTRDAGSADAGESDGGKRLSVARDAGRRREAGVAEAGADLVLVDGGEGGDGGPGPSVKDTLSLVGGLKRVVKGKPNVSLVFWFSTMREHPLGPLVGSLLACIPQWRDFLGDQIDPLQDLDGIMLMGPRMSETSKVTLLVQSRMEDSKLQRIMAFLAE